MEQDVSDPAPLELLKFTERRLIIVWMGAAAALYYILSASFALVEMERQWWVMFGAGPSQVGFKTSFPNLQGTGGKMESSAGGETASQGGRLIY